jgi:hypothetical protein
VDSADPASNQTRDGSLHRRRVSKVGTPAGLYYSGPFTGSFCQSGEPVFISTGNDVHAHRKYWSIAVFWEKGRFYLESHLLNSGLGGFSFFYHRVLHAGMKGRPVLGFRVMSSGESLDEKMQFSTNVVGDCVFKNRFSIAIRFGE